MFVRKPDNVNAVAEAEPVKQENKREEIDPAPYRGYWEAFDEDREVDISRLFMRLV